MDGYMKWNCYDLAEQMEVFERCKREFRELYEGLLKLTRMADGNGPGALDPVRKLLPGLADILRRLNTEQSCLEQAIDIYYAAETQVRMEVESLRTAIGSVAVAATGAAASAGNAVMEDWLAALVFSQP